jgi:tetrahydromethanopterin S-methyltransferase subunit G
MERMMWSDTRLDERFEAIDRRFDSVDRRFDGVDSRLDRIDADIREMRSTMYQLWGVNMLGIVVTLVAIVATSS